MKALISILCLVSATAYAAPPTFEQLIAQLGLDQGAADELRAGKIYTGFPPEVSGRDIAAGLAFVTHASQKDAAALFFQWADVTANTSVRSSHALKSGLDLATLSLGEHGDDECKRLAQAAPGDELNLSDDEIAAFRKAGPSRAACEQELRSMLLARFNAYRSRGLAGIAPYARGGGRQLHGDEELRSVGKSLPGKLSYSARVQSVLAAYPKLDPAAKESFRWIVYEDDHRPRVALRHRVMIPLDDGNYAFVDRELYVTQGYNTMQGFAGMCAIGGGSLVLFRANTSTDRVDGSASAMKHSIGRRMMAKQLAEVFERFRERLDK